MCKYFIEGVLTTNPQSRGAKSILTLSGALAQEWEYVPALTGKTTIPSFEAGHPGPCSGKAMTIWKK